MIVVTGATGHIGNNLVRACKRGHRVRCMVLRERVWFPWGLDVEIVEGDVRDIESHCRHSMAHNSCSTLRPS